MDKEQIMLAEIHKLREELHRAINEHCLECGTYELEFRGACDGCHFYNVKNDKALWEGGNKIES